MHRARLEFKNSDAFKKKLEVRHRIEEKNGEMKTAHGFRRADSVGLIAMRLGRGRVMVISNSVGSLSQANILALRRGERAVGQHPRNEKTDGHALLGIEPLVLADVVGRVA